MIQRPAKGEYVDYYDVYVSKVPLSPTSTHSLSWAKQSLQVDLGGT